ncbi:unnamed protein product [Arabidopsis thaliana]|uniref:Jacalin-type lectin domain-containing protein n=1 Tax=Arabidopsis thaliana TaxID=3702 RepID=A0A654EVQ5_ARATH|nr:unnamed protein product [Arabidopsis thaliana]
MVAGGKQWDNDLQVETSYFYHIPSARKRHDQLSFKDHKARHYSSLIKYSSRLIHQRGGFEGIQYIKFDYVKSGQPKIGSVHGLSGRGFSQVFEIDHLNNEHLVSVEGYYDDESTAIQALQFKTNIKTSELLGYEKVSVTKSVCHGSKIIKSWDDGVFHGIRKVYVSYSINHVACITFDYISNHSVVKRQHGNNTSLVEEFELDYPNEFITSVDGTFKNSGMRKVMCVTSLVFKTSKGRISPTYGSVTGTKFVLETKGCALAGFHGWTFLGFLTAIGAYFSPLPCPPNAEKLEARGYGRGAFWDDGVYDGVRKIYVGQCENGIAFLKFVYDKDTRMVIGDDHGNKTPLEVKELDLEYPGEYVTAVEGCYNKGIESDVESITMLKFETNKRTSISFGFESSSSFLLEKEGFKIVGFHGKASNMIHQLGVHVMPITH